jgi:hypothetical protein
VPDFYLRAPLRVHRAAGYIADTDSPRGIQDMTAIDLPRLKRPVDLVRWLVSAGLLTGLVLAVYLVLVQFEAKRECRGGAFSAGFSRGFDVRRCDLVVRRFGRDIGVRVPLPRLLSDVP